MDTIINKAHKAGDINPRKPDEIWTEFAPGKFDWRKKKGSAAQPASPTPQSPQTTQPTQQPAQGQPTATPPPATAKQDKIPTPKIKYSVGPHPDAPYHVPETWYNPKSKEQQNRDRIRELAATKWSDDALLHVLNNKNGIPHLRQIAFEEAAARAIPESKIDVSGTLQKEWDKLKRQAEMKKRVIEGEPEDEEEYAIDDSLLRGWDREKFMSQFGPKEDAWADPDDDRVQREFNGLKTLTDRRKFDTFVDIQSRMSPKYHTVTQRLDQLGYAFFNFFPTKEPMLVSSGGAGAGKSTKLKYALEAAGLQRYDPKTMKPSDTNYDYVYADRNPEDSKDFEKMLADFNGKIIIFDDKDKPLMTTSIPFMSVMKAVADEDPTLRVFHNPNTADTDTFTGKLIFLTNKSKYTLYKNEDRKAMLGRGGHHDINLTINDTLDLLRKRYKTMGQGALDGLGLTQSEEDEVRQIAYDYIVDHRDELDPATFTVRHFNRTLKEAAGWYRIEKLAKKDPQFFRDMGRAMSLDDALESTLKAQIGEDGEWIEKAEDPVIEDWQSATDDQKKRMRRVYREHPELFVKVFGQPLFDYLKNGGGDDNDDEEVKKAFMSTLGDMTVEEAESVLFS